MKLVVAIACSLIACTKADDSRPSPPSPVPVPVPADAGVLKIQYAAKTEVSALGVDDTYFSIHEDDQLFMVGDANGRPGDPARLAAEAMAPYAECETVGDDEAQLRCALSRVERKLRSVDGVASFSAVAIRGNKAIFAASGDVEVLWIHDGKLEAVSRGVSSPPLGARARDTPPGARHLEVSSFTLPTGDMIAIANSGLIKAVGDDKLVATLTKAATVEAAVNAVVDEGLRVPGHGALDLVLVRLVKR